MSSFKAQDLFGSGPHRTAFGRQGYLMTLNFFNGGTGGGSTSQGVLDLDIFIRGRLVAESESSLWTLRNAIRSQISGTPGLGTLIDTAGRSWTGMALIGYREAGRRDLGRKFSMRYEAQFRKLGS
ncbi:hypothetical protein LBMAG48_04500 [Phycisphaerae bacterium]|nr:hypothetical protein LBMAG48_04500 [Phycisphaerae bacterium]